MAPSGNYVVVWGDSDQSVSNPPTRIWFRRYDASGHAVSGETLVSSSTNNGGSPKVAIADNGDFAVLDAVFNSKGGLYVHRYSAAGAFLGKTKVATNFGFNYDIAMDASGNFAVAYETSGQDTAVPSLYTTDIQVQRFNAAGTLLGEPMRVNSFLPYDQEVPSISMNGTGSFVVAWQSHQNIDDYDGGVYAQRFNAAGAPQGANFRVNTTTARRQEACSVAMSENGGFVVGWQTGRGDFGGQADAAGQIYDANGDRIGGEFIVKQNVIFNLDTAIDDNGNFVFVYGVEPGDFTAYASRYAANGMLLTGNVRLSTTNNQSNPNLRQYDPAVGMDAAGNFVAIWHGYGAAQGDRIFDQNIYGRLYRTILDFGDAPASYGTLFDDNGASHFAVGATLGATRDFDSDGKPTANATGDDNSGSDDEDGLVSQTTLTVGGAGTLTINAQGVTGTYFANAWIDFNKDGDWQDAGEQVAADVAITSSGNKILNVNVPAGAIAGNTLARLRLSTATGLSFDGEAPDGEIEDHVVAVGKVVDLLVTHTASTALVIPGTGAGNLSYRVTVQNKGPSPATGLILAENLTLPAGVSVVSVTPTVGSFSNTTAPDGTWNIGSLASGASAMLDILLTVGAATSVGTNVIQGAASVAAANETRVNQGDDAGTVSTSVIASNITAVVQTDDARPRDKRLVLTGSAATDQLAIELGAGGIKGNVRISGQGGTLLNSQAGALEFSGITAGIGLSLLGGNDVVKVVGRNVRGPVTIDGGLGDDRYILAASKTIFEVTDVGGNDVLDFSQSVAGVKLNLSKTTSQGLGGGNKLKLTGDLEVVLGGLGNDKLTGNAGDNILVGGGGKDSLNGGTGGMDLLIGGDGKDQLRSAVGGNNLLIGGLTTHDANSQALLAILNEWRHTQAGALLLIDDRIAHLHGTTAGGLNGGTVLTSPGTVSDDGDVDTFKTAGGANWFIKSAADKLKKPLATDRVL